MSVLIPSKPTKLSVDGTTQGLLVGDTGLVLVDGTSSSITAKVDNQSALRIDKFRRLGINVDTELTSRLEILDSDGDCIKLIRGSAQSKVALGVDGTITFDAVQTNIGHGFSLRGEEVLASAGELDYTHVTTIGVGQPAKAIILDSTRSARGINLLSVNDLIINRSLTLDMNSDYFSLNIQNSTGKCLRLSNDSWESTFTLADNGMLYVDNNGDGMELSCASVPLDNSYPLQVTSASSGVGIKFNAYNKSNIKRNMSSIETIILNNEDNMENSVIRFNNMNDGLLINTVTIRNDGYIICNTLLELSDMRKKRIIDRSNIFDSLNKINSVNTYNFMYLEDNENVVHKGVMAQELQCVIPAAVNDGKDCTISNKEIIAYLIDSIKALHARIDKLEATVSLSKKESSGLHTDYPSSKTRHTTMSYSYSCSCTSC